LSSYLWTDILGRTYEYEPYDAQPIADLSTGLSEPATLAVAEASRALGTVPALPAAGIAAVLYRSESSASSIIEDIAVGPRRILEAEVASPGEVRDPIASRIIGNLEGLRDALATPFPAGPDDYLRWHRLLSEGHPRMKDEDIGAYRRQQNWIGGDGYGPGTPRSSHRDPKTWSRSCSTLHGTRHEPTSPRSSKPPSHTRDSR